MFGLALAVKWSALSFYIAFWILGLLRDRGALKPADVQRLWRACRRPWLTSLGPLFVAPLAVYLMSYQGWFAGENGWSRHCGNTHSARGRITRWTSGTPTSRSTASAPQTDLIET
jgi:hypothetical protein